jgi:hypothetical protein
MYKFLTAIEQIKQAHFYLLAVLFGMLIAAQIQYIQHGWINPDSVTYFESARLIALGDFQQALKVFPWPMYSACIALVHKITQLDIHQCAQFLSVIFFGLTTFSFLKIIQLGGGNQRTMFAGMLILFSSLYIVGDILEMLMRDHGFWAFYLTSLIFLIRFKNDSQLKHALAWQFFALLAMLFRIEGIIFLMFLPTIFLFDKQIIVKKRIVKFLQAHLLNLIITLAVVITMLLNPSLSMKRLGRLEEVFTLKLWDQFTANLFARSDIMADQVLGQFLDEFAVIGILLTFIYVMIFKAISISGPINVVLAALSLRQKRLIQRGTLSVLKASAYISFIIMGLIITKVFVLSGRYIIPLAFIVMLLAAFQFGKILNDYCQYRQRWLTILAGLLVVVMLACGVINILPKPAGYNYIQDAGVWVKQQNIVKSNVFYFDTRLRFFAEQPWVKKRYNWKSLRKLIRSAEIDQYDYLMLAINDNNKQETKWLQSNLINFVEIKRFSNEKNQKHIVIYQKQP